VKSFEILPLRLRSPHQIKAIWYGAGRAGCAQNDNEERRRGVALLVVLFVVMAITVLSLGFLSRSNVELACGENMILRTQMDYLAESGLEHAKGLILKPQDVSSEYWTGGVRQQLTAGSDYYDVNVVKLGWCNYQIICDAYREKGGEEVGRSSLRGEVRLDPAIALWTGTSTTVWDGVTIEGDVDCNGTLTNEGVINGDVFANGLSGAITGQQKGVGDLPLAWPHVTVADFTSKYPVQNVAGVLSGQTFGPYEPVRVCYCNGDLELAGSVAINGMLVVGGDLTVRGSGNVITAAKNLPALLVTGDVIIEDGGQLNVDGLAVVDGKMQIGAGAADVGIVGGLFINGGVVETVKDWSGNGHSGTLYNGPTWRPAGGQINGALEFDGIDDKVEDTEADSYLNGLAAVTVLLWVKSDVTNQNRGVMFSRDPTDNDEELGIRYDNNGAFGGGVNIIKASIRTGLDYTQIESSSNVQTTGWQHLGLVWESGSSLKLYVDGQPDALSYDKEPAGLSGTISGVQKLMLGCDTKSKYWDGLIDDVRIYDCALDANEIYPVPSEAGLVAHWRLDEQGSNVAITAAPSKTAVVVWSAEDVEEKWAQATGAFFRSIRRD